MLNITKRLFDAFREDHATLGRGLHAIATHLRAGDLGSAATAADALDRAAGAHIAFEEHDFYPALRPFLDREEVEALYRDHRAGQQTLRELLRLDRENGLSDAQEAELLRRVTDMEHHVSECGELFGAMGGLTAQEKRMLLQRLDHWRMEAPRWTQLNRAK